MKKQHYHYAWEEFAQLDPKWSIITRPDKKYNKWDEKEFFKTGEKSIQDLLEKIKDSGIKLNFDKALDFGCGIGRATRALSKHFNKIYGVDISKKMISDAKKLHKENKKIEFIQNTNNNLLFFNNNKFDLIFSIITLQHIPSHNIIKNFLVEFIRILKPGGILYFQLPTIANYPWLKSTFLKLRGFLYYFLTNIGFSKKYCYSKLKLAPYMHMNYITANEIKTFLQKKAIILKIYNNKSINTSYLVQKK